MKRSWIGVGLLAFLLAVSMAVSWGMDRIHAPVARDLEGARTAAVEGDWQRAKALAQAGEENWKRWQTVRSCFADHNPIEEIDARFARLAVCSREEFPALAGETAGMVKAMGDAHGLEIGTFF